jgi:hypothetical protein
MLDFKKQAAEAGSPAAAGSVEGAARRLFTGLKAGASTTRKQSGDLVNGPSSERKGNSNGIAPRLSLGVTNQ